MNEEIFESQLLRGYVEIGDLVYHYIVIVGKEMDGYAKSLSDLSDQFMIDKSMNLMVDIGKVVVSEEVKKILNWNMA